LLFAKHERSEHQSEDSSEQMLSSLSDFKQQLTISLILWANEEGELVSEEGLILTVYLLYFKLLV